MIIAVNELSIEEYLKHFNVTASELARRLGVPVSTLNSAKGSKNPPVIQLVKSKNGEKIYRLVVIKSSKIAD